MSVTSLTTNEMLEPWLDSDEEEGPLYRGESAAGPKLVVSSHQLRVPLRFQS